jgi:hypothetical protein
MDIFAIDQHISVVADLKKIFGDFGHHVSDVCMSGHAAVMGRSRQSMPMLDGDGWCGFDERKDWIKFYNTYGRQLEKFDAFLACYPPIFAMLYRCTGKPVIIDIPIRYEYGVNNSAERWERWNDFLREGVDAGRVYLVANSEYDKRYTEAFLGKSCVTHIPNLCEYTGAQYKPTDERVLYYSTVPIKDLGPLYARKHDTLAFGHSWQDVASFRCIVHFPYQVSTMSIFEQYTSNIPLLFPTKRFLLELYQSGYPVLEQVSWNATYKQDPGSKIAPIGDYPDPNDYADLESIAYWLQFADFYNAEWMQNLIYFDSFDDLNRRVVETDFQLVSDNMKLENAFRKDMVYAKWNKILMEVEGKCASLK